ncbi:mannan endo-1,6-alpha-mannosidase DCW1 precursor [Scheffersomyces coipomensis]|uniref:mannan endo-1,6-alpha-mannosidase DCW1 precursor n=1 Tax=Scheffersomyces coipomensis TaxID=1788519 RepID=UPI00315D8DAD
MLHLIVYFLIQCLIVVNGLSLDINDRDSICAAAKAISDGEWNYYEGLKYGGVVGMFAAPNYWWNAGEAFGGLLDYFSYCDPTNETLESLIYDGMYHQAGAGFNYIPSNQSMTEGNDDQGVWGMAIMQAVERNFTNPPDHSWLSMTQAVYNTMNARWDNTTCDGGLRWQIFTWNSGYDYKNSIANGCLFHLAARLARYLGNDTYVETAEKVWDWMYGVGFMVSKGDEFILYDGADISANCTDLTTYQWSYTYGIMLSGCAYLYDYTGDDVWLERSNDLLTASGQFFNNSIMYEMQCAPSNNCNNDQRSFRSLFARSLGLTSVLVNSTAETISGWIDTSSVAAAQSCSGGSDGITCGFNWAVNGWDGVYGLGEQQSALETVLALLTEMPLTASTGGTSISDVNAGLNTGDTINTNLITISTRDKAGAGVLTAVVLGVILAAGVWMVL